MAGQVFATKANLMATRKSLDLSSLGFDLLDRKRNVLIRELMQRVDEAKAIKDEVSATFRQAYFALQQANMSLGKIDHLVGSVPVDDSLQMTSRSVMGVEIPLVSLEAQPVELSYGFMDTSALVDEAYIKFDRVKKLTAELAEVENSVYRLATAVNKTQKRANALKNIILPRLTSTVKYITDSLEEKEREDFSRLKVIKTQKNASRKENT